MLGRDLWPPNVYSFSEFSHVIAVLTRIGSSTKQINILTWLWVHYYPKIHLLIQVEFILKLDFCNIPLYKLGRTQNMANGNVNSEYGIAK